MFFFFFQSESDVLPIFFYSTTVVYSKAIRSKCSWWFLSVQSFCWIKFLTRFLLNSDFLTRIRVKLSWSQKFLNFSPCKNVFLVNVAVLFYPLLAELSFSIRGASAWIRCRLCLKFCYCFKAIVIVLCRQFSFDFFRGLLLRFIQARNILYFCLRKYFKSLKK